MFDHVDRSVRRLITERLDGFDGVAVVIGPPLDEAPDQPTLCCHLWRIRNVPLRGGGGAQMVERDGEMVRRARRPEAELAYAVTAHAPDASEAHALLAQVFALPLRISDEDTGWVVDELLELDAAPRLQLGKPEDGPEASVDRPACIDLRLVVPVDLGIGRVLAPAPGSTDLGLQDERTGARSDRRRDHD